MHEKETMVTANAEPKKGFSLENHSPLKNFHLLALGMDEPVKTTVVNHKHGTEYYAEIPRKYLGVDRVFQRKINSSRVAAIKRKWTHQAYRPASVVECFLDGKYYYTITDGQHRACAYPTVTEAERNDPNYKPEEHNPENETVFVQLIKDISPVRSFVISNDKKTTKPLSHDETFWAVKAGQDDGETGDTFDDFIFIEESFEIMRSYGWTPMRYSSNSQDAGTHASAIHKYWTEYGITRLHKKYRNELEDLDKDVVRNAQANFKFECVRLLRDTFTLMSVLMDSKKFSKDRFGGEFWAGMIDFLCNPDCQDMKYDIGELKRAFSHRVWKEDLLSKSSQLNKLTSLSSLELGRASFVNKTYTNRFGKERSLNRTHLQSRQLVYHVYHTGLKMEGKTAAVKPQFKLHS